MLLQAPGLVERTLSGREDVKEVRRGDGPDRQLPEAGQRAPFHGARDRASIATGSFHADLRSAMTTSDAWTKVGMREPRRDGSPPRRAMRRFSSAHPGLPGATPRVGAKALSEGNGS